jgi:hypothetical protein
VLAEEVRDLQEFPGITAEAEELREDEAGDALGAHVLEHALRFRLVLDRLSGDCLQVVHGDDGPALHIGVHPRPLFVMLGTVPFRLFLGGDANPDADSLRGLACWRCFRFELASWLH